MRRSRSVIATKTPTSTVTAGRAPAARPLGRPRSERAHAAILGAAVALTREVGFDAVTMEAIASRAGVGKATVYRHWPSKEELIAEAIAAIVRAVPVPDTGDTERDLRALMTSAVKMYADPATAALLTGLLAAMARRPAIAAAVRSGFVAAWRAAMHQVLARGIERGDLRRNLDLDLAVDLLGGPLFHRYLMTGGRVDERLARSVVDLALHGIIGGPTS